MGQYWLPVNLDRREFIHPHKLGCGLKLVEQLTGTGGVGDALVVLLAAMPDSRGGGDFDLGLEGAKDVIGRWAGDRIALVGDYAEDEDLDPPDGASMIFHRCSEGSFEDISDRVCDYLEKELKGHYVGRGRRTFRTVEQINSDYD